KEFDNIKPAPLPVGRAVTDVSDTPSPLHIPGKSRLGEMIPAFLTVLGEESPVITPPEQAPNSTGRRLALARWMTRPDHPLTARVWVNRQWERFFGKGLVKSSENFGVQSDPPSHPELLDWLATEFIQSGWDMKHLQKLIVMSATYRQDSGLNHLPANLRERDPENRLLARGPRLRLSAEAIRDQALAISGLLDFKIGGPSVRPY
ncbi:MAG: DUF1553 domain-containing protein, partial [Planctomycetaceae bacterium]|nr:DUF1553 domain-containing protein [Planctomycetaceae bacterium]